MGVAALNFLVYFFLLNFGAEFSSVRFVTERLLLNEFLPSVRRNIDTFHDSAHGDSDY